MTMAVLGAVLLLALIAVALFWHEPNGQPRPH
jgi:nitrogen fixation-related uncharacterized protein